MLKLFFIFFNKTKQKSLSLSENIMYSENTPFRERSLLLFHQPTKEGDIELWRGKAKAQKTRNPESIYILCVSDKTS